MSPKFQVGDKILNTTLGEYGTISKDNIEGQYSLVAYVTEDGHSYIVYTDNLVKVGE